MTSKVVRVFRGSTLLRSLAIVVVAGVVLIFVTDSVSSYRNLQIAYGGYYFCVLAGLTVLAGASGQISLGQGAFMAVGAYTFAKLNASPADWSVFPSLIGAVVASILIGIPVGVAASRLRGPYLAGATLAFAVGLPAVADKFPAFFGGENGLIVNPPIAPPWLGANFQLERWEAWLACAGALVVVFVLYNLTHSAVGRSWRAVRDDEIAASLAGLRVSRQQALAFTISAGCAGLGGGLLAAVTQVASPGAFPLQLSLTLLAGVVIGGLGSLVGALWGAALLVLLPNWTQDLANSFSLSGKVSHNLPIAIYGLVLMGAMLLWPSGIQGGVRAITSAVRTRALGRAGRARPAGPADAGRHHAVRPGVGRGGTASPEAPEAGAPAPTVGARDGGAKSPSDS